MAGRFCRDRSRADREPIVPLHRALNSAHLNTHTQPIPWTAVTSKTSSIRGTTVGLMLQHYCPRSEILSITCVELLLTLNFHKDRCDNRSYKYVILLRSFSISPDCKVKVLSIYIWVIQRILQFRTEYGTAGAIIGRSAAIVVVRSTARSSSWKSDSREWVHHRCRCHRWLWAGSEFRWTLHIIEERRQRSGNA